MAEPDVAEENHPRGSLELVETSILDTIVPLEIDLNIEEALSGSVERLDEGSGSPLASIPQRHALYFGQFSRSEETLCILLILR
jgi:hypothetical protein